MSASRLLNGQLIYTGCLANQYRMRHCVDICLEIVFFKWGNLVWMNGFGVKVSG